MGTPAPPGYVNIAGTPVPVDTDRMESDELVKFLRKRGLFVSDGAFQFFEALVVPGSTYELARHEEPASATLVVRRRAA